jgi:serine/threonine protein kinase
VKICPRCSELLPDDAAFCPLDGTAAVTSSDPLLGRAIAARYRVLKRIGAGGMANVYLARHVIIERLCAIKVLRPDLALNPASRERFLREARAVNRINHPNIVEITDYGEFEGMAYLVMEYVEGESLLAALKREPFAWPRAAHLGAQVAGALGRAHQMGVIHRDLKPENVILVGPPEMAGTRNEIVKLTDFGIAKIVDAPSLTFSEQMFGTPGYIAPEYIEGGPADARADLYSFGVVLYEMVTTALPYDARTQADKLVKALSSPPIPPRQRVGGLPTELESLILRLLARRPEERPRDAFAVLDALNDVLRRYANSSLRPPPLEPSEARLTARLSEPPKSSPTLVEPLAVSVPSISERQTAVVEGVPTGEIALRWSSALTELEASIASRKESGGTFAADRALELAGVARDMTVRVERAQRFVADAQSRADRLEAEGRDFRANIGHAIDSLVIDRSRERAHIEALTSRRARMDDTASGAESAAPESIETRLWERAALAAELDRASKVDSDLTFQIEELQKQLEAKNERFERDMIGAGGALEGSLSALRRLTNELVRTLDEAAVLVGAERPSRSSLAG